MGYSGSRPHSRGIGDTRGWSGSRLYLVPGERRPGPPSTQSPNVEAVVEYHLVSTGTSVPPITTEGPAKDTDGVGVPDALELKLGTDPFASSSGSNGIKDGESKVNGINSPVTPLVGHTRSLSHEYTASLGHNTRYKTSWGTEMNGVIEFVQESS